jgi:hypothetical protein
MQTTNSKTITVRGRNYLVVKAKPYEHKGNARTSYTAKLTEHAKKLYLIIGYENGTFSEPISTGADV